MYRLALEDILAFLEPDRQIVSIRINFFKRHLDKIFPRKNVSSSGYHISIGPVHFLVEKQDRGSFELGIQIE